MISLVVSSGPPPVPVPKDLAGKTLVGATSELQADGLAVGAVTSRYDENAAPGVVLGLGGPVPTELPQGSKVPLVVSKGAKPRTVPTVAVGTPVAQATSILEALGLHVTTTSQSSTTVPAGQVLATAPGAGTQVPKGATVQLVVSSGPPMVVIPSDIIGKSVTAAAAELQADGLSVSGTKGSPLGTVTGSSPGVGTKVRKGTSVELTTG